MFFRLCRSNFCFGFSVPPASFAYSSSSDVATNNRITVAAGDGIGPEITNSTLAILDAAKVGLKYDFIDVGEKVYLAGDTSGISQVRHVKFSTAATSPSLMPSFASIRLPGILFAAILFC